MEAYEYFEVAKELAEKENRMILTKSLSHATQLRNIFKKEHVLYITEEKVEEQVSFNKKKFSSHFDCESSRLLGKSEL